MRATLYTNAQRRFCFILLTVALLKSRALGTSVRSSLMRIIPPVSFATSVPLPMAIPTSAAASAGASFIPSPTMTTFLPSLNLSDMILLLVWTDIGEDSINSKGFGDSLGRSFIVTREHHHLQPHRLQRIHSSRRRFFNRISEADEGNKLPVYCKESNCLSLILECSHFFGIANYLNGKLVHYIGVAQQNLSPFQGTLYPEPRQCFEI